MLKTMSGNKLKKKMMRKINGGYIFAILDNLCDYYCDRHCGEKAGTDETQENAQYEWREDAASEV